MIAPALLIITGHPATGKTTLANLLAAELSLPLLSKDVLKETLFDSLGWCDRAWSRQVGVAAITQLYRLADSLLFARRPFVIESNFRADLDTPRMQALAASHSFRPVQIRCVAAGDVLVARIRHRIASGQRHPGHCDELGAADLEIVRRRSDIQPLPIGGALLTIDTTDPACIDYPAVLAWARAQLAAAADSDPPRS